jgi:uncharacterized membrane protein required for colicin V production
MKLPFNWFDIAIPIVLIIGVLRGRKHGMSEELMLVLKWIAIIFGCAFGYQMLGDSLAEMTVLNRLQAYITAYLAVAGFIAAAFWLIKKLAHGKLVGSDVFGGGEYYLGMAAGFVRYACILIFALALLNARLYTQAEIKADMKYQNEWYGSDFFPGMQSLQSQVFETSFTGPYLTKGIGLLFIKSTPSENKQLRRGKTVDLPS